MSEKKGRRLRRTFTDEFKQQIVDLYLGGKRKCDIVREYDIGNSTIDRWISQAKNSGSFREKDNRTAEENELIKLQKEIQQLKMENDILKQAALIMGRK
jgi:transposase